VLLVVQFVYQMILAKYFGASANMDAYMAAITLPTVLTSIFFASGGYAFVPVFSEELDCGNEQRAWMVAGNTGLLVLGFSLLLALATSLLAGPLTAVLYPGLSPETAGQTVDILRILAWLIVTNGLILFLQSIHHCHGRFAVPAIAPVLGTVVTLGVAIFFRRYGIVSVAWAVLAGSAVAVLAQTPFVVTNLRLRARVEEGTRKYLWLMLPLVCGSAYCRLEPLVDRYLASGLPVGSISHLGYAWRLASALLLVATGGLSSVAFPSFARHLSAGRQDAFRDEIARAMRCLALILVPIGVGLSCYHEAVVRDLFQRGKFTAADTEAVAWLLLLYSGMLIGAGLGEICAKIFYALSDTRTPMLIGASGFTLGLVLKLALAPGWGVAGLVVATSLYYVFNAVAMAIVILRRLGRAAYAGVGRASLRALLASIAGVLAAYPVIRSGMTLGVIPAAVCGLVVYLIVLLAVRDEFAWQLVRFLLRTITRREKPAPATSSSTERPAADSHDLGGNEST
jgi:putative peptidoglycan lipid II flippase